MMKAGGLPSPPLLVLLGGGDTRIACSNSIVGADTA
jgi:hypothetical protein